MANTDNKYKEYLASTHSNDDKINNDISKEIAKCKEEFNKIVSSNIKIISRNSNSIAVKFNNSSPKNTIKEFVTIAVEENTRFSKMFDDFRFYENKIDSYSICQFDLKCARLGDGSTIDCDNTHIKLGPKQDHYYCTMLPFKKHVQGYKSGQHCFRMYYKKYFDNFGKTYDGMKDRDMMVHFGIYPHGVVPKSYCDRYGWGVGCSDAQNPNTHMHVQAGTVHYNGRNDPDEHEAVIFLYSLHENQIDMLIDFDKGTLSYSLVDDKENRQYTLKEKFDTTISYSVYFTCKSGKTEAQIAKINTDMFGKNKRLVKWPIAKY